MTPVDREKQEAIIKPSSSNAACFVASTFIFVIIIIMINLAHARNHFRTLVYITDVIYSADKNAEIRKCMVTRVGKGHTYVGV